MLIRSSILRTMERRLELRLCSMLSPVKKVRTNSARESRFIFGRSASIFLAKSCFSLLRLRVMMPTASGGNIAHSRMVLTAKHPFCPARLHGPILRNRDPFFGSLPPRRQRVRRGFGPDHPIQSRGSRFSSSSGPIRIFGKSGWRVFKTKLRSVSKTALGTDRTAERFSKNQSSPNA